MRKLLLGLFVVAMTLMLGCTTENVTSPEEADPESLGNTPLALLTDVVTLEDLKSGFRQGEKVSGADVGITAFSSSPTTLWPGDVLSLQATVSNLGTDPAVGPFDVWIGVLGTSLELYRVTLNQLAVNEALSGVVNVTVPVAKITKTLAPGFYTLYCTHTFGDNNPPNNYLLTDVELRPANTGDIKVSVTPETLNAPWVLDGPGGYQMLGAGAAQFTNLDVGIYTITWGSLPPYITPVPETLTLVEGATLTFSGVYLSNGNESMMLYFENNAHCTTGGFLDHVTAFIVYDMPIQTRIRGFECGIIMENTANTSISVTYPGPAVDVGTPNLGGNNYNYVTGYASPFDIPVGSSAFVLATLDIFILDAGPINFILRPAAPSSDPNGALPMVLLDDYSLVTLGMGMAPGSPSMVLNPVGDCPVIPYQ